MVRKLLVSVGCCLLALTTQARGDDPPQPDAHGENSVAFAPDGKWLVTGGSDGAVRIRDGTTGAIRATLAGHSAEVTAVAVSPDGRMIASVSNDCSVRLWDVERRAERRVLQTPRPPRGQTRHCILAVVFAPDGRTVATGDAGDDFRHMALRVPQGGFDRLATDDDVGYIRLWDAESGKLTKSWVADSGRVNQVLFSPDGATIASVGSDPVVKLWDTRSHALRRSLPQPGKSRLHLAYAPDGATLAVSRDFAITLWDPGTGVAKDRLRDCPACSPALAFTPDGDYLAVTDINITHLCSVKARGAGDDRWSVIQTTLEFGYCSALVVSPDGRWVAHCFAEAGTQMPKQSFKLVAIR